MKDLKFYDKRHRMEYLCGRATRAMRVIHELLNRRLTNAEMMKVLSEGSPFLIRELKKMHPEAMPKGHDIEDLDLRLTNDLAESLIPELDEISKLIDFETEIMNGIIVISADELDKYVTSNEATF